MLFTRKIIEKNSDFVKKLIMPDDIRYADDHEWAKREGDAVRVGLDDYAQDQLGDIVFVGLPEVGDNFKRK